MGSNQNLKAFVRYDGSNRVVAGSLIFRRKKPTVGKWHEINRNECCNFDQSTIVVNVQSSFPFNYPDFVLESDGGPYTYQFYSGDNTTVNDVYELADYNNNRYGFVGTFKVLSGELVFTPNASTAAYFAAAGADGLAAYSFAD
jgi:hypothetical protein